MHSLQFQKPGLIALAFLLSVLTACADKPPSDEAIGFSGSIMGTTYSVQVHSLPETADAQSLDKGILAALQQVDRLMSTYKPDSEISRFNALPAGEGLAISKQTATVLEQSLQVYAQSNGAFDISVGPLIELWGFGRKEREQVIPSEEALAAAKTRVNLNALVLSKDRLEKTADIAVNLSAVAKGYAVDQVALYLDAQRIEHYLVEVGGELRAKGMSPRGSHWRIGIERPDSLMRNAQVALPLVNKAVATSGDYRNYVEKDGKRYSHTIDPRTGWPIDHKVASVTVVHDESAFADAWATALMVPGLTEGQKLAEQHGLAVFWIVRSEDGFDTAMSSAYQRYTEALEQ